MNTPNNVPLVILAGSDRRRSAVPEGAEDFHFLVGYKGADFKIGQRTLIQELLTRVHDSGVFGEVFLAGPEQVYRPLVDCRIVDTDGTVGDNIRAAIDAVTAIHGNDTRIAFLACDVLPSPSELSETMAGLTIREGSGDDDHSIPALAISLVQVPESLGASGWKPKYLIKIPGADKPVSILPSHLGVAYPKKLRTGLLFRSIELVYQERNRDYEARRRGIVFALLRVLIWRDLMNIFRLHPPTLTYSALRYGLGAFLAWRKQELTLERLALGIEKMVVHREFHQRPASGCVRITVTPHFSFAQDIDTREELEEVGKRFKQEKL